MKKHIVCCLLAALCLGLFGCGKPAAGQPGETTSAPQGADETAPAAEASLEEIIESRGAALIAEMDMHNLLLQTENGDTVVFMGKNSSVTTEEARAAAKEALEADFKAHGAAFAQAALPVYRAVAENMDAEACTFLLRFVDGTDAVIYETPVDFSALPGDLQALSDKTPLTELVDVSLFLVEGFDVSLELKDADTLLLRFRAEQTFEGDALKEEQAQIRDNLNTDEIRPAFAQVFDAISKNTRIMGMNVELLFTDSAGAELYRTAFAFGAAQSE